MSGILLATYVFSGCDTVSYPYRRGKKKAAQIALRMTGRFPAILAFGDHSCSWEISSTIIKEARQNFVALYGHKGFESLDKLCEHIFATTKSDLGIMPPTEDSFHHQVLRSLYQFALYKRSTVSNPQLPLPTDFSRKPPNDRLIPIMMEKVARPDLSRNINLRDALVQLRPYHGLQAVHV